MAMLKQR